MTTNQPPELPPDGHQVNVTGLAKLKDRMDRPSPYGLIWRSNGKRKREYYADSEARDRKFRELEREAKRGTLDLKLSREDARNWMAFKLATGGVAWQDVVAGWKQQIANGAGSPMTTNQAVERYLADLNKRKALGKYSASTLAHKETMLERFRDAFDGQRMSKLSAKALERWIVEGLGFTAPGTFDSYRRTLSALFNFFVDELPVNPVDKIYIRDRGVESVGILTVAETAKLFAYAKKHYPKAVPRLAVEAFAGLRFSSSTRLEKSEINFKDRGVLLPKHKIKTDRKHYVDGYPDNLWSWLDGADEGGWALEQSAWMHLKSKLFLASNVPHPHNCLRHSFCTHHIAAFKNPGLTATLLCHRSQEKLWDHYNGMASQEAGKAYWTITPATAESMATDEATLKLHYPPSARTAPAPRRSD